MIPSKHLAFLSFHICQITARMASFHISFPLCDLMGGFQAINKSCILFGKTQLQPNQLIIVFQIFMALLHCRRRWSTVFLIFQAHRACTDHNLPFSFEVIHSKNPSSEN
eukprot:TRINITY_DN21279_c2_g2_i1.p1 TRINITY_DN21279_c2_g2~~TRINITY_DN21279_c2_g2_i1.p1  ORF type:complete len:109 (+),score=6.30 TRINITY_DN21279_c2_g2_i1:309-635(+)